jgi:hypothetical protein
MANLACRKDPTARKLNPEEKIKKRSSRGRIEKEQALKT